MHYTEFKERVQKFKNLLLDKEEQNHFFKWVSNEKNEDILKGYLLQDIRDYKIDETSTEKPSFEKIFEKIELSIADNEQNAKLLKSKSRNLYFYLKVAAIFLVIFTGGATLSYFLSMPGAPDQNMLAYNEISAPLGARSEVLLSDGSKVWLNAGSKIRYINSFNHANRTIILDGEGYFKVAKNKRIPFIVKADELSITAVGTEFNVKAYSDEGIIETTLVEGEVTIQHNEKEKKHLGKIFLQPFQKAVYIKENQDLKIQDVNALKKTDPTISRPKKGAVYIAEKIDPMPEISWKESRLIFKSEEMNSLAVKLERKYNINIKIESEIIKQYRFTGTLEDETLTQALDVIKFNAPIDYTLEGKEVNIFEDTRMMKKFDYHLKKK